MRHALNSPPYSCRLGPPPSCVFTPLRSPLDRPHLTHFFLLSRHISGLLGCFFSEPPNPTLYFFSSLVSVSQTIEASHRSALRPSFYSRNNAKCFLPLGPQDVLPMDIRHPRDPMPRIGTIFLRVVSELAETETSDHISPKHSASLQP